MNQGLLINDLELGYAPLSAFHFSKFINDKEFHSNVFDSHIYIIAQRKEVTFSNFFFWERELELSFDIEQEDSPNIIRCILPVSQKNISAKRGEIVELRMHNRKSTPEKKIGPPFKGTQAFTIQSRNPVTGKIKRLAQFTPDKLFQNVWKGHIKAKFNKSYTELLEYNVQYVGKSTEQNICKRLTGHSTFQEILINQTSLSFKNIPSNEIMIMLFRVKDNNTMVKWGVDSTPEEITEYLTNYMLPSDKTISLDAEKALIKHLQPEYNKILYKSFPSKTDLVHQDFHNSIFYGLSDPIKLIFKKGELQGNEDWSERNHIIVDR
ncbi:hypothetical protein [Christiangramia sp. OXR-203]|jgi:hypothetical protein|uniref:hypothetical protein n=1 Tax=Christiangramia sp. OXR-203 TaxID=3100176 RepID=UPI002AC9CE20|nr:hypothetical protein [Christiangramia sp. OXR-203]WPY97668.1 hypothetical protein T8I65_10825 [Christiangramia sp. OXR-203]